MKAFKYELGDTAIDLLTGFSGVISYRVEYLTGCPQYGLLPKIDEKGEIRKEQQFDENRIRILDVPRVTLEDTEELPQNPEVKKPGGPNTYAAK